ncbi:hypothetical protein [Paenibacillus sp. FJAT-26967]|uniref:hypothetical protein n=1 Tax=Paenibacillus sp. FJAT-26967 TaxID=1729690 RepID=UPI0008399A57|nr:hypothetical protein [Paenibacillus sp. FJAT-26967]
MKKKVVILTMFFSLIGASLAFAADDFRSTQITGWQNDNTLFITGQNQYGHFGWKITSGKAKVTLYETCPNKPTKSLSYTVTSNGGTDYWMSVACDYHAQIIGSGVGLGTVWVQNYQN